MCVKAHGSVPGADEVLSRCWSRFSFSPAVRGPRSKLLNQKSESPRKAREVGMGGTWRDSSFVQCLVRGGQHLVQSGGWVKG